MDEMLKQGETHTLVVDIDGTLCGPPLNADYSKCEPYIDKISAVNKMYDMGNKIILFTSRGMRTYNGDIEKILKYVKPVLVEWLTVNNVKYNQLIFGKPWGQNVVYIDDRSMQPWEFVNRVNEI